MAVYLHKQRKTWCSSFYYTDRSGKRKRKKKEGFKTKREAKEYEDSFCSQSEKVKI